MVRTARALSPRRSGRARKWLCLPDCSPGRGRSDPRTESPRPEGANTGATQAVCLAEEVTGPT